MSDLSHCQVGDKQEWSDKRDYVITQFSTRVNVCILLGELWWNVVRTRQVLLYSSVNGDIAHIAVQYSIMTGSANKSLCLSVRPFYRYFYLVRFRDSSNTQQRHIAGLVRNIKNDALYENLTNFIVCSNKCPSQDRQPLFFGRFELRLREVLIIKQ
jgi:hypothetical protein